MSETFPIAWRSSTWTIRSWVPTKGSAWKTASPSTVCGRLASRSSLLRGDFSHAATGEIIHEITVPQDLALELFHRGREAGISLISYHKSGIFCDMQTEWTALYKRRTGQVPIADIPALIETGVEKLI